MVMTHPTMYEVVAIHAMHMVKVKGYQAFNESLLQSGIVMRRTKLMGHVISHQVLSHTEFGHLVMFTMSTEISDTITWSFCQNNSDVNACNRLIIC